MVSGSKSTARSQSERRTLRSVHHHGLLNMRDRLNAIGGHLTIHARPGDGTQVIASIPLPDAAAPDRS